MSKKNIKDAINKYEDELNEELNKLISIYKYLDIASNNLLENSPLLEELIANMDTAEAVKAAEEEAAAKAEVERAAAAEAAEQNLAATRLQASIRRREAKATVAKKRAERDAVVRRRQQEEEERMRQQVAEEEEQARASMKIQARFRGRAARAKVEEMAAAEKDRLKVEPAREEILKKILIDDINTCLGGDAKNNFKLFLKLTKSETDAAEAAAALSQLSMKPGNINLISLVKTLKQIENIESSEAEAEVEISEAEAEVEIRKLENELINELDPRMPTSDVIAKVVGDNEPEADEYIKNVIDPDAEDLKKIINGLFGRNDDGVLDYQDITYWSDKSEIYNQLLSKINEEKKNEVFKHIVTKITFFIISKYYRIPEEAFTKWYLSSFSCNSLLKKEDRLNKFYVCSKTNHFDIIYNYKGGPTVSYDVPSNGFCLFAAYNLLRLIEDNKISTPEDLNNRINEDNYKKIRNHEIDLLNGRIAELQDVPIKFDLLRRAEKTYNSVSNEVILTLKKKYENLTPREYKNRIDKVYPHSSKDTRGEVRDLIADEDDKTIAVHGTTLESVVYSILGSNCQIIPLVKLLKLGIPQPIGGESQGKTKLNSRYVSCIDMSVSRPNVYDAIRYAKLSVKISQKNDVNATSISKIPAVVLGDGADSFNVSSTVSNEIGYKRLNTRIIYVATEKVKLVVDIIKYALQKSEAKNNIEIRVSDFEDLGQFHENSFAEAWERAIPVA